MNKPLNQEDSNLDVACIKIPIEHFEFIKNNPKVGEIIGGLVVEYGKHTAALRDIKSVITQSDKLAPLLENGTVEELKAFIKAVLANVENVLAIEKVTIDQKDEILNKLTSGGKRPSLSTEIHDKNLEESLKQLVKN